MKYRINVTKKDIREHWNGSCDSCPIHEAMDRNMEGKIEVGGDFINIDGRTIKLSGKALKFSTLQADRYCLRKGDDLKKEALRKLKPFSFVLNV